MRGLTRSRRLLSLGMLLVIPMVVGGTARADLSTTEPGSIIVFPKVVADGSRDTIIHLTNTSNMNLGLHCFYTNAYSTCANDPNTVCTSDFGCIDPNDPNDPNEVCTPFWDVIDFDVRLTAQQPTFWRVSTGRSADVLAGSCRMGEVCSCEPTNDSDPNAPGISCPGFTSQPGGSFVAPQGEQFIGELRCYEVNPQDPAAVQPMAFNKVKGEAIIETLASGEISAYNAVTIQANAATDGSGLNPDLDLVLNRQGMGAGEYNACGDRVSFTHHGVDSSAQLPNGATGSVDTEVTLVPCSFIDSEPIPVQLTLLAYNQAEERTSQSVDFPCYFSERLSGNYFSSTFDAQADPQGQFFKTEFVVSTSPYCWTGDRKGEACNPAATDPNDPLGCPGALDSDSGQFSLGCLPSPGVVGVFEEFYSLDMRPVGTAAGELYNIGQKDFDIMVVPPGD